ncbi:hypothetical protein BO79DRAFT_79859 [Aspergillus costaricaensis CBS 115574]|uniref:Uncharacterized protein n=1 Tax=Aspergillus costaricaensis CBS 115574 TaxID=1448317 RepID=A0ACD1IM66_9EURO|nr:hypothetical protein BO79DRAFT_79859 [Aspergillus costaricaensis CBS 115574]RAK91208.1 hypothetical protein BO79DRAFT_79859 [Aspergillus costaricaensis CBS 115574]
MNSPLCSSRLFYSPSCPLPLVLFILLPTTPHLTTKPLPCKPTYTTYSLILPNLLCHTHNHTDPQLQRYSPTL